MTEVDELHADATLEPGATVVTRLEVVARG